MNILVDADACPKTVKEILFRVAERTQITVTLFANHSLSIWPSRYIKFIQVQSGFDVADKEILVRLNIGDLVITGDIPLAYEVLEKGGHVINPRGERYTSENIKELLNMRDFMDTLRSSGVDCKSGPAAMTAKDSQMFANQLDRFLAANLKANLANQ
jgi:uncharacterized protein YaiI (UPF0178 family)